jgi:site-specific DNA recombinase
MLRSGEAAALLVYAVDRLTREQNHIGILLDEAARYEYRLEIVTERLEDTPEGKLVLAVRSYAAEVERLKIRERSIRGKRGKLAKGQIVGAGSDDPYGYRLNRETWRHEIVEAEAVVVRRVFELCAVGRYGMRAIAERLHAEGYRTRHGKVMRSSTIWRVLRSPLYKGVTIAWRWEKNPRTKLNRRRNAEDHITLPEGATPPIVAPDLWAAAQTVLEGNRGDHHRNRARPVLLRGMVYCGYCGLRCYARVAHGFDRFRCSGNDQTVDRCKAAGIQAHSLERAIWAELRTVLKDDALIQAAAADWRRQQPAIDRARVETARAALAQAESAEERLLRAFADAEGMALDAFRRELERLERRRTALAASVADLEEEERRAGLFQDVAALLDRRDWRAAWLAKLDVEGLDFDGQRDRLEALALRVVLRDDTIDITGSLPIPVVGSAVSRASISLQHRGTAPAPLIPFSVTIARPKRAA